METELTRSQPGILKPGGGCHTSVMANFTCQLDVVVGCPGIRFHIVLDVFVRVFLDEI